MEIFETNYVSIWIEDGILFSNYKKQINIDEKVARQIVKDRIEFTKGKSYPILIDFTNLKSATKEARDYMNDPKGGLVGLLRGAFLSNNVVTTVFINLYLKINKPSIPTKFFTNKQEALAWLKSGED